MTGTVGEVGRPGGGELISRLLVGSVCGARETERGRRTYTTLLIVFIICHRPATYENVHTVALMSCMKSNFEY